MILVSKVLKLLIINQPNGHMYFLYVLSSSQIKDQV